MRNHNPPHLLRLMGYSSAIAMALLVAIVIYYFPSITSSLRSIALTATVVPSPRVNALPVTPTSVTRQPPTSIYISRLNKRWPIQAALVHGNEWDLFPNAVAWLSSSAVPGEGNVVLYAHDWVNLWADLYQVKPGDTIEVEQNTKKILYLVTESREIDQHDVNAILSTDNQLTLYTCAGSFDQKRRLVYAKPQ